MRPLRHDRRERRYWLDRRGSRDGITAAAGCDRLNGSERDARFLRPTPSLPVAGDERRRDRVEGRPASQASMPAHALSALDDG